MNITKVIENLTASGMIIEKVGEDTYNVISQATGAVLERLIPSSDLVRFERCISYVTVKHGADVLESYKYIRPVHSSIGVV